MTKHDFIRLAEMSGFKIITNLKGAQLVGWPVADECPSLIHHLTLDELVSFGLRVEQAEREACAQIAEKTVCNTHIPTGIEIRGTRVAAAIRERSK